MIKKERKKTYCTMEIITDVICDNCGKSLINEDDFINRIEVTSLYYIKDIQTLSDSGFYDYKLDLCNSCYVPIKEMLDIIARKIK